MKIKLLVSRCGPGVVQNAGDVINVEPEEAQRMVAAEQAEYVRTPKKAEKAVK